MRLSTSVMLVALFLVPACKKKPTEGSQAQADADYTVSKLSTVCDGAKVAEAKAYGASGPHSIAIVEAFAESSSGGVYAVVAPKSSVAEIELVGCVEHAGSGSYGGGGPSTARVVRARDGVEIARFALTQSSREANREDLAKEFDPYVRGTK